VTPRHLLALALLTSTLFARCGVARAQDDALYISQLVVNESGLTATDDCEAIVAVLLNGSQRTGMTPAAYARVYAPRFASHATPRAWVHRLTLRAHDPRAGIAWSTWRPRWLAILARVSAALLLPPVCPATDWSSPAHMRRRIAAGRDFTVVDCGDTRNAFAVRGE
jgi:hypothetical protein